jgi:anti-sigma factor RsiW
MICRECETWMSEFLAGTLPGPRAAELERHLAACATCRQTADQFRKSVSALREAFSGEQPLDLKTAVLARQRAAERPFQPWWVPALAGAGLLVALMLPFILRAPLAGSDSEILQAYAEDLDEVLAADVQTANWSVEENTIPYGYIPDSQLQI